MPHRIEVDSQESEAYYVLDAVHFACHQNKPLCAKLPVVFPETMGPGSEGSSRNLWLSPAGCFLSHLLMAGHRRHLPAASQGAAETHADGPLVGATAP